MIPFYDHTYAETNHGARLENIVACALLKELQFIEDTKGLQTSLNYLRTKDGREIDFLICIERKPILMLEVKWSDDTPTASFQHYNQFLPRAKKIQLVKELNREKTFPDGVEVRSLLPWLSKLDLSLIS